MSKDVMDEFDERICELVKAIGSGREDFAVKKLKYLQSFLKSKLEGQEKRHKEEIARLRLREGEVKKEIDEWEDKEFGHYQCDCVPANPEQVGKLAKAIIALQVRGQR